MQMETQTAAYICHGCGIADRINTAQLEQVARDEGKINTVVHHDFLCSSAGVQQITKDIDEKSLSHVVLAACSARSKTDVFQFDSIAVSRANLREGVIWSHAEDAGAEDVQSSADDYMRMSCAEIRHMRQPSTNPKSGVNRRILVIGGGVSGMTAALETARTGYEVLLCEKSDRLGGWGAMLHRRVPLREPFSEPEDTGVATLIAQVQSEPGITVFLSSTIGRTSGAPGQFSVDIQNGVSTRTENVGAIVQASGFRNYDASNLPELGFGKSPDVVDQSGLEKLAVESNGTPIRRPSDNSEVECVVFIQCAGQRSEKENHLPYCSGHCCNTSIKQALYFKNANPNVDVNIIYDDLRTPGNSEDFYRSAQLKGVNFTKGSVESVDSIDGKLEVRFNDKILAQDSMMQADMVVLATGQIPNSGQNIETEMEQSSSEVRIPVDSILNLDYRQGKDLPHLQNGFSDSHFVCFPYETRRTGIYACGPVRRPMDIAQAMEDATGAAMKAIQAVESAYSGRAAHPRSGDLSFPSFRKEGCTQCKRCTVECPFGAIDEDERGYPVFNESRCRRCGTCMGACPVRVISFENYSVETVGQQIKAVDMPDEFEEKPRILVLACENDAYPALDMASRNQFHYSPIVRTIPVRCLGSVNSIWVTDALNSGYDGVMLMGCKRGEDYQCHFVKGSELAHDRMSKIDDTLEQLQLETQRVVTHEVEITDVSRVSQLINEYAQTIDEIGLNPFKGF